MAAAFSNGGVRRASDSKITSGLPDVEIPRLPLNQYVLEHASNWEDRTAFVSNFVCDSHLSDDEYLLGYFTPIGGRSQTFRYF